MWKSTLICWCATMRIFSRYRRICCWASPILSNVPAPSSPFPRRRRSWQRRWRSIRRRRKRPRPRSKMPAKRPADECPPLEAGTDLLPVVEGIAGGDRSAVESAPEPLRALRRRPVREGIGRHMPGRHLLQAIVANRGRRSQRGLDVALLEQVPLLRGMRPHARKAIRLQFHLHGDFILHPRVARLQLPRAAFHAYDFLHVMANLVREDVGLRKQSRCAESLAQLVVKTQV